MIDKQDLRGFGHRDEKTKEMTEVLGRVVEMHNRTVFI